MIKRFFILLLATVASVGMSYALTPRTGDSWDDNTKTLTVNSDPDDYYNDQGEIKRLVISSSVTEIGEQAFSSSYNLESVIAYDGLQVIDQSAFVSCPKLESVILPSSLREVRYSAFSYCDNLKYVTINASSLDDYAEYAFDDTHADLKIYVPEASVATYKYFWSAYADKFQAIPSSLAVGDTLKVGDAMYSATDVYVSAGYLCFQIKASSLHTISVIEPNGSGSKIKVEITPYAEEFYPSGSYAALTNWFYCYSEYTSGNVTAITVVSGAGTLADPFVIDYVEPTAPAAPAWVRDGDTWDESTKTLTVNSNTSDNAYASQTDIEHLIVSDAVTELGWGTFFFDSLMTTVELGNNLKIIGISAFNECKSLSTITVPASVTNIKVRAFCDCTSLTTFTCEAVTPPTIGNAIFEDDNNLTAIYVPAASVDAYKSAWSDYASLIKAIGGGSAPTVTWNSSNVSNLTANGSSYSKEGVTLGPNASSNYAYWLDYGNESQNGIYFYVNATGGHTFSNSLGKNFTKIEMTLNSSNGWYVAYLGSGWNIDGMKVIWTGNASTVDLLTETSSFGGAAGVKSIVFYFEGGSEEPGGGSTDVIPCTAEDLGKVLCTDGSIYATVGEAAAASKTAAAVIAYVDTQNGKALALALADDGGEMDWATANTTAAAHTPAVSHGTWTLASKDDWDNMITAAGSYTALRDGFSAVGGTNMKNVGYWSSTSFMYYAWCYKFNNGEWFDDYQEGDNYVRACLAFDIPATPAYETVMNLIQAIGTVELTAECKAKIDAARTAYNALSDGDKDLVTNIKTLTTAEAAFENVMNIWLCGDCDVILWNDTTLTVRKHAGEGNGAMADYNYMSRAPWYNSHWNDPKPGDIVIKSVTIEEGVTHLGDYAFAWMSEMKTVTIPSSVTTIPSNAFFWSKAVDDIYLSADASDLTWTLPNTADVHFKPNKGTNAHVPADLLTAYQEKFGTLNVTFVGDLDPITPLTPEQQQALDAAKGLINAIPSPVVYTPACKEAIDAARAAYDALTPDMLKQLVSNYATLTAAETTYANLKDVAAVEAKINNIPQPVELTLATRDSIQNARAAYDALTADQQALVPAAEYQKLLDAEAALAEKNPGGGMPAGALSGKFTINADGDQIAFAKGNLQATTTDLGANWTWGFAANQWNCLMIAVANSKINGNGTVSENGTVDLFGWSTAATYYGINNSDNADDYPGDFVDWGPNMGAGWRTLTKDEWNYLIENNTKGRATVNDKNGYIFLPNDWSGPAFTPDPNNFTTNVYSGDDWTAMENAGAVFLPCGPARLRNSALVAMDVKYYSSTSLNKDSSYVFTIYYNQSQSACTVTSRAYGCMVRLVTEGSVTPLDSAQVVKDLIDAIPVQVSLEDACVNAVQAARDAYNALADATKGALDDATVQKLNQAITDYTALIQAGADEVIAKINNIPQPVKLKLATRDSIENARAAYDALTADQKALVTNYGVLEAAEATWAGLINVAPAGALSGKYTINENGDFIYFAHGNLQYTRENLDADWSTGTFRLATNQYDLIEAVQTYPNAYCTDNYGDKTAVGLFGWGTWGEGKTPNLTSSDRTLYTWSTDFSGTLEGTSTWRTLTKDEWVYLLTHSNLSYATVHGVNGLLVAPDGKDLDGKSMADWVVINDETWTTMQNDGYLFLPACGQRSQLSGAPITTGEQGEDVVYYSSTEHSDVYAYNIWYKPGQDPAADDHSNKRQAFGIRLVSAGVNPLDQAQAVKDLIDAIPVQVSLEDACVNAIKAAREAYDALSEDAQGIIDPVDVTKLTDAEADLTALNQAEADKVIAKINNIPLPVELKLATRDSIQNARAAYDALTADQKALVPDAEYQKLLDAEAALAEKNQGGSASVDIVWDINTGIANVDPNTTSPAYDGITITTGNGNRFYQTTTNPAMLCFFFTGGKGSYAFAKEDGTHFTKVELISSAAMSEWLLDPSRIGTDWVVSDEDKKATWIGDADTVKIWDGIGATNWVNVDSIVFTVSGTATPLDSAQAVKDLIEAIREPLDPTEACGAEVAAALNAYDALSDAAKGALDNADVQKLNDAATQYPALDATAAIEAIPAEINYDPMTKSYIEIAKTKYDALSDASKALVPQDKADKLTNAVEAWAILVAKIEHNVTYIGKDGELKNETVALLHIPDPAPDFNGYEFVRWDVKAGDFLEEGLRIKAVYTPIITTNPMAYDTLEYNGLAQELVIAGEAKDGHIEYSLYPEEPESWSANLPTATNAAAYVVYYKLVREGHEDYMAGNITVLIAKTQVSYTAPVAYDTLVYNYNMQTLIEAGITNDGIFEYTLTPGVTESWNVNLPQAQDAGTYSVYYRVIGDINHFDSTAVAPVAVTIAKRDIVVEAPVAYDTLVYNAAEQTLVIAGSADFNVMEYSLDTTVQNCWSIELPKAVTADPYTVYYRVPGDDNHNEYEAQSIAAFIAQAPLTITAEDSTIIYGDAVPEFIATYSGWQGQDDETVVSNLAFSCAYQQGSYIGTYVIQPHSATAHNYAISFVNGTLTVNKAHVYVSGAEAHKAKFADGHAIADVTEQGILNGIKLNDPIAHVTTAAFSSADVAKNLDITLFYELTGDAALLNNYYLDPTSNIFTHEGVIIEPFLPDNDDAPEDEEATVEEGIEVYAYGYCDGEDYKLKYHLNSGYPNQYKIEFEDSHFTDVDWTPLTTTGRDGTIDINIPVDLLTGDYKMTVIFRDSLYDWLPSEPFNVTFHVNLPETYVVVLLDNTIALIDTCHCLTDVQWYHRNDASELWQPIEGATNRYYFENGGLTGEYFVKAKMNGVDTYTCPQTDVETLYDGGKKMAVVVRAYPSPAIDRVEVSIENSDVLTHMMTIVNMMGSEIEKRMFNGNKTTLDVSGYQSGNYMISVDGNVVKVIKK